MSSVQTVESLRPFEKALVNGYFLVNFNRYTPTEIINLCIFYCFIFDEFAATPPSNAPIKGINNEIVTLTPEDNDLNCTFSRNLLEPLGRYHWEFKITKCNDAVITVGFMQNNKYIKGCSFKRTNILHIYLDADNKKAVYKIYMNGIGDYSYLSLNMDDINNIRLYIRTETHPATIEMIAFHDVKWFMNRIQNNEDALTHINYARSIHDIDEKLKHYLIGLKKYPLNEAWNSEYLICLQQNNQYDAAFNHALKYKKGENGITALIDYFYSDDDERYYEKAISLLELFDDETLEKRDLFWETAYCYDGMEDIENNIHFKQKAFKYYELYYNQHQDDIGADIEHDLQVCIGNMANIQYSDLDDEKSALELFLKLNETEIKRREFNGIIGHCYFYEKDYENALKYYQLHLDRNPNELWIYEKMYFLYSEQKEYDKAQPYLLNALNFTETDKEKVETFVNLGVNAYCRGNLEDAIKFTKQTLELSIPSEIVSAVIYANLGKYHYRMNKYDESYQYILEAIKINPNEVHAIGNYGIILYFLKRSNESIVYLEKCLSNQQTVNDPELLPDCLYIYGQILYDRNEFNKSIDKCLKVINMDEFIDYRYKDKIYHLMSINYKKLNEYDKSLQYALKTQTLRSVHFS